MTGSLAPPPPYGSEQGSILLEGGRDRDRDFSAPTSSYVPAFFHPGHGRSISAQVRLDTARQPLSPGPRRSPTDISLAALSPSDARENIGAIIDEEAHVDSAPRASLASVINSHDNHPPATILHQYHDYQLSSESGQSSGQAANAAAVIGQHKLKVQSALAALNQRAEQSVRQRQQGVDHEHREMNNETHEDEPPPPEYESPDHSPSTESNDGGARDESRPLLPSTTEEGQQAREAPPIPSYDAAVADTETRRNR